MAIAECGLRDKSWTSLKKTKTKNNSRNIFIVKYKGAFEVSLFRVDVGHSDHLHARAEVTSRRHVVVDFHRAASLGQSADSLFRRQVDIRVIRHLS